VKLETGPPFGCVTPDPGHSVIESSGLPADLMVLAVGEGATEHRGGDDVRVASGVGQCRFAIHCHQDENMLLARRDGRRTFELVVETVLPHWLSVEKLPQNFY